MELTPMEVSLTALSPQGSSCALVTLCVGEKLVSQEAVLPPAWDERWYRVPVLVKLECLPFWSSCRCRMDSCLSCRAWQDQTCSYRWRYTSLEVMGVAHGHSKLQRVREGVHCHAITMVVVLW